MTAVKVKRTHKIPNQSVNTKEETKIGTHV